VAVVVVLLLAGAAAATRVTWVATRPPGRAVQAQQVAWLETSLAGGAAHDMQGLFPEGFAFTWALAGLAAAQPAAPGDADALAFARQALAALDSPAGTAPFPAALNPPHGAFWAGWSLRLAVEVARLSGTEADRAAVRARAAPVVAALREKPFLESYPGQVWPVDTVVAVAALARADAVARVPGAAAVVRGWPARTERVRDPRTGLLPHALDAGGRVLQGPRGSSQALMLAFEPDLDPGRAARDYRSFVKAFVVRRAGLLGVREYPVGTSGVADVDSGPLVLGVSLSASAVAGAAGRRQGDDRVVRALDAEAELLGAPITWAGRRRYAAGQLPVGDAFLAWSRAQTPAAVTAGRTDGPGPLWAPWALLPLAPGLVALLLIARRRRSLDRPQHDHPGDAHHDGQSGEREGSHR
jgi:hypothetical protein